MRRFLTFILGITTLFAKEYFFGVMLKRLLLNSIFCAQIENMMKSLGEEFPSVIKEKFISVGHLRCLELNNEIISYFESTFLALLQH